MGVIDFVEYSAVPAAIPTQSKTVAVVDMVGYRSIARILEENMDAQAVAELNRQIQSFISRALSEQPDKDCYHVVAKTGDGIIVLFDRAEDAHSFATNVHLFADAHNILRSESTAERWFRIGIATGEVVANVSPDRATEFAGLAISSAVRLEGAATAGEIIVDGTSYSALPQRLKALYGAEQTVKGKKTESFRARRFCVVARDAIVQARRRRIVNRRTFLGAGASVLVAGVFGGWLERDHIYRWTHPLPARRHVALIAWPHGAEGTDAMLAAVIDSIRGRLSRAEAYVDKLVVVTAEDMAEARNHGSIKTDVERPPQETAYEWGANLILAATIVKEGALNTLVLKVLDAEEMKVLRQQRLEMKTSGKDDVSYAAPESAAKLLDLPVKELEMSDSAELAAQSPETRNLYVEARFLAADPNGVSFPEAIEKFQELVERYSHFALGYASLGGLYIAQFERTHDAANLEIAARNLRTALTLNSSSEKAQLGQAIYLLDSGQPDAAIKQLNVILKSDPGNSAALFFKARAFGEFNLPADEEDTYRTIIRNRPNFWFAYNQLGTMFYKRGDYAKAEENFKTASVLAPRATTPLINLGVVYLDQGRKADAQSLFLKSNNIAGDAMAYEFLGTIAYQDKNYADALKSYLHAEQLTPRDHDILSDLADCYEKLNQPQEMKTYYTRASDQVSEELKINPNQGPLWMTLAFYEAKIGRAKAADSDILQAESHGAADVESLFTKARTLAALGRSREAEALVIRCLDQGLSPVEVELTSEFDGIKSRPSYLAHTKINKQGR